MSTAAAPTAFDQLDMVSSIPCTCPGSLEHAPDQCPRTAAWWVRWQHDDGSLCWSGTLCDECNGSDAEVYADEMAELAADIWDEIVCEEHGQPLDFPATIRRPL